MVSSQESSRCPLFLYWLFQLITHVLNVYYSEKLINKLAGYDLGRLLSGGGGYSDTAGTSV